MADWIPAFDASNWQNLTPQNVRGLADAGMQLAIIRGSHENKSLIDIAYRQVQMCLDVGLRVHLYFWCYFTEDAAATAQRWRALYEDLPIGRAWLDCEETKYVGAPAANVAWLQEALRVLGEQWELGIYTGKWWWVPYMGNSTAFSNLPLWDADYTGAPLLLAPWSLYGGWTRRAIHQYTGNGSLGGISPLDLDAVDPALLGEDTDMPQVVDLINQLGYLQGDVADALQRGVDGARIAKTKAQRDAAYQSIADAIATLRRGG